MRIVLFGVNISIINILLLGYFVSQISMTGTVVSFLSRNNVYFWRYYFWEMKGKNPLPASGCS